MITDNIRFFTVSMVLGKHRRTMKVNKHINFRGRNIYTTGTVVKEFGDYYVVDFTHDNTEFRGYWLKNECMISNQH